MRYLQFLRIVVILLVVIRSSEYLPGGSPVNYCPKHQAIDSCKDEINVFVNRLNSAHSVIPYEYDHFDFCKPTAGKSPTENLGQVVFGERIRPGPYQFSFGEDKSDKVCTKTYDASGKKKIDLLRQAIRLNYQQHWVIDNMPVSSCYVTEDRQGICYPSFPVGCYVGKDMTGKDDCESLIPKDSLKANTSYIFNHVEITLDYQPKSPDWSGNPPDGAGRLLKAQVTKLASIIHSDPTNISVGLAANEPLALSSESEQLTTFAITYSYAVTFKANDQVKWSSRWNYILDSNRDVTVEWFSMVNSCPMILFLSAIVAKIPMKLEDGKKNCFGWKLVHGDVFRPPQMGMLLSIFLGSGVQLFFMALITLIFACLGFLSPANPGALMTCSLVLFVCLGSPAGYVSSRIYKMFGGEMWMLNVIWTAFLCPGIVLYISLILNLFFWMVGSSAALPFSTIVTLVALWLGVSVPLTFAGAYFGFKKKVIEHPVLTCENPRQIPYHFFYGKPLLGIIMGAIPPFSCYVVQLRFILNSIWLHQLYNSFGFLFLVFIILVITCSETTIVICYFHLCVENYHWWWRSFLTTGFTGFYFFLYSIFYYVSKLEIDGFLSIFMYFGYSLIMAFIVFLVTGTIGFFSCFCFVTKLYGVLYEQELKYKDIVVHEAESEDLKLLNENDIGYDITESKADHIENNTPECVNPTHC